MIKVYITADSKKMLLMVGLNQMVYEVKRKIEAEYSQLFPNDPPFVCAKLQDQEGYVISSNTKVMDVIKAGDIVTAVSDVQVHGGRDSQEHIIHLKSMQK